MKIAITGASGLIGRAVARELAYAGHELVLIARGSNGRERTLSRLPHAQFVRASIADEQAVTHGLTGCDAVAHCAGINREIGEQTYAAVHIEGTRVLVRASQQAGVKRIAMISFLRARPGCGSGYHESKWAAEEIVRASGLT